MALFTDIQAALDQRLAGVLGIPTIAFENVRFTPVAGTSYVRPTVILGTSALITLDIKRQTNPGIYSIAIFTESEKGPAAANTIADAIYDNFKAVNSITEGSTDVWIQGITRTQAVRDEAWYTTTVDIQFLVYST